MTSIDDLDVGKVVRLVHDTIDLDDTRLGDEFFPAHVSVALLDAVFSTRLHYERQVVPIIERYCTQFNLRSVRSDRTCLPPIAEQETLSDLVDHYEALGPGGFQGGVVQSGYLSPGTSVLKSETVRKAALALRGIGIETLQDAEDAALRSPDAIKCALRPLLGIGDRTIHMFLMYAGGDDFVKGDVHVCRFVARALHRDRVPADEAERLVAAAARATGIAPRHLDYEIWKREANLRPPVVA